MGVDDSVLRDVHEPETEMEEAEEIFEDAIEDAPTTDLNSTITLDQSMDQVNMILDMALNNQFEEGLQIADKWAHTSLYHALGRATLCFFKGVLTLEPEQIKTTMDSLKHVINLYQIKRRQMNSVSRVVWKPNYNHYTEGEIHAELVYAEAQLMIALMTFLQDQNLVSLVKGALKIRSCYQSYKECSMILNQRISWSSEKSKLHFESGVRMGIGAFNLMISHLPGKVLRLLEFVGFSGNRNFGFTELEKSTEISGLRSPLAKLIVLAYHCYIEHLFGLGSDDLSSVKDLLKNTMKKYPNSAFFILFSGRINQLEGDIEKAIQNFQRCITIQNQWKQLHNICYWELLWCYSIKCDWKQATKFADILRTECAWSPATYTYQCATLNYMSYEESGNQDLKAKTLELLKKVPSLRIRYAGKTIPAEKFAITMSERYVANEKSLAAPALEFMYIWNIWAILEKRKDLVDPILAIIETQIAKFSHVLKSKDLPMDDYLVMVLLKGMCLRSMGYCYQAEECFLQIILHAKRIVRDTYLAPHAAMELGLTFYRLGQLQTAVEWLEKARKNYSGYLIETMVHFRVHCALRNIQVLEQKEQEKAQAEKLKFDEVTTRAQRESTPESESLSSISNCSDIPMDSLKDTSNFGTSDVKSKLHSTLGPIARSWFPFKAAFEESAVKL